MNTAFSNMPFPPTLQFGWIGLGAMGFPMAFQLRKKMPRSCMLTIYDIDPVVSRRFVDAIQREIGSEGTEDEVKVAVANNAREVAEKSDCVITIVPEGAHVRDVFLTPVTGILTANDLSGKIFIDCSTIDIATSRSIGDALSAHDSQSSSASNPPSFYDGPVSGGTAGACSSTLTCMLGISPISPNFPLLRTLLSPMCAHIHAMGGPSLGLAAKLSNNYLSGLIALATSEAMNMGMRLGLDPLVLSRCFQTSSGGSWVNENVNPVPGVCPGAVTSKGYEGGFKVQLMKKDMTLAVDAAKQVGARLVLGDAGVAAYTAAAEDPRCRNKDSRVVYRWLGGLEPSTLNSST